MEDLFKPFYKNHKRINFDNILDALDVFDPQVSQPCVNIGDYELRKESAHKWTSTSLPGLQILSGLLSADQQRELIEESVTDFLENPEHLTNLDAHYTLARPIRLFDSESAEASQLPDTSLKPTGSPRMVRDKLRWVTLGGQYNWTTKVYPSFEPGTLGCPYFPNSLTSQVCGQLGIKPEAAIVNYYGEGDILSPHQDVAELTNHDLISISLGCTCIFYVGLSRYGTAPLPIVLRSGDIVVMGGEARFAYHRVGRIFGGSTPSELYEIKESDAQRSSWIRDHRININVRQMQG